MSTLPTDIAATYEDRSAGDTAHQEHHDEIHGEVNAHGGRGGDELAAHPGVVTEISNATSLGQLQATLDPVYVGILVPSTLALRPAASADNAGWYHFTTDVDGGTLYRSNGVSWSAVAPGLAGLGIPLFARNTADQTVNNSTGVVDATDMSVNVVADAVYEMDARLITNSSNAAGFKIVWSAPTGATLNWSPGSPVTTATAAGNAATDWRSKGTSDTHNLGGVGADIIQRPSGLLVVGGTAGVFKLRFAQQTVEVSDTILRAMSFVRLTRVA